MPVLAMIGGIMFDKAIGAFFAIIFILGAAAALRAYKLSKNDPPDPYAFCRGMSTPEQVQQCENAVDSAGSSF
jgi:hypothetical protein